MAKPVLGAAERAGGAIGVRWHTDALFQLPRDLVCQRADEASKAVLNMTDVVLVLEVLPQLQLVLQEGALRLACVLDLCVEGCGRGRWLLKGPGTRNFFSCSRF